jgi:uncharacterized membrane protein
MRIAMSQDRVIEFKRRPGDFDSRGDVVALAWPAKSLSPSIQKKVAGLFIIGVHRTPTQDLRFGLDQLVSLALRALSPFLADPRTALMCLDRLGEALIRLAGQAPPSAHRCDLEGKLRILDHPPRFEDFCPQVIDPIRTFGMSDPMLQERLMAILIDCARAACLADYLRPLATQARLIRMDAERAGASDRDKVEAAYQGFLRARTQALGRLAERL